MALDLFAAGGGGRFVSANNLPRYLCEGSSASTALSIKYALGSRHLANQAGFYTTGALYGATNVIAAADTWATLCDISGAGELCNVVSPEVGSTLSGTNVSIEITVDGVVTTYTWTADGTVVATDRVVIGVLSLGYQTAVGYVGESQPNSFNDEGFVGKKGGVPYLSNSAALIRPDMFMQYGLPAVEFKTSLKVRVKASVYNATAPKPSALVTYRVY